MNEEQRQEQYETNGGMVIAAMMVIAITCAFVGCGVAWVLMHVFGW